MAGKENTYISSAKVIGAKNNRILFKHILPNIMPTILILFTVDIGYAIISEATVSFLGYGIPAPTPSWGSMLSKSGRQYMLHAPWMALWPGSALAIVVFGMNMLGDAVRDLLDPRLRGGSGRYGGVQQRAFKVDKKKACGLRL